MIKKLVKHGNSYALIIDKPILDLLKITPDTPLEITTDGRGFYVASPNDEPGDEIGNEEFQKVLGRVHTNDILSKKRRVSWLSRRNGIFSNNSKTAHISQLLAQAAYCCSVNTP